VPAAGSDPARHIVERTPSMILFLIGLLIIGLIAGFIARALVPGPDPMGIGGTILLGIIGSFVGGFLGYLLFGHDINDGAVQASGVFGSIVGAVIVLLIYRAMHRRRAVH
jgi:uncharacterized membrane protein YeaQ/YmgE (transglycosylase-associated protein family)